MRFNISNEEVKTILEMHSKERKNTFLIKEDAASDEEKLRIGISSGCLKGGTLKRRTSSGDIFYRKPSKEGKEVDFFADMTFKFVDGSRNGKWKCDAISNTLSKKQQQADDAKSEQEKADINKVASDANAANLKKEGGWKTYEELIATETKENIANPAMYEKKVVDGVTYYRRTSGKGITSGLDERQQKVVDKWIAQGAKLEKDVDAEQAKVWTRKLVSPKSEGLFSEDFYMYFPPTTITNAEITTAFEQAVQDQTPTDSKDCKKTIEAYYMAFKKKKTIEPNMLNAMKEKVQACKNEFKGNWGAFGGGRKLDEYLDVLSGVKDGSDGTKSPRTYGDDSKWKL
jgi:hypothetical protein